MSFLRYLLSYFLIITFLVPQTLLAQPVNTTGSVFTRAAEIITATEATEVTPDADHHIQLGNASIYIPAGAVTEPVTISIQELSVVRELNAGMENVTTDVAGYRFLPHGMVFEKDVYISLPYNQTAVQGDKLNELYGYYYNEVFQRWIQVPRAEVRQAEGQVVSRTNHFTDYINSTLALPETAKPLDHNPNSIKNIEAANPYQGIPGLDGFKANSTGSASFSMPFKLGPGRGAIQPQLSLQYSSQGGQGIVGRGFSIPVQQIQIDTTFGVPSYTDSDTYLFMGEELIKGGTRVGGGVEFFPRVNNGGHTIVRKGSSPTSFYWEIISTDGTVHTYGQAGNSRQLGRGGNVFTWFLESSRDVFGNTIQYTYYTGDPITTGSTHVSAVVPKTIEFVSKAGSSHAPYKLSFIYENRNDQRSNGRSGTLVVTNKRLSQLEFSYSSGTAVSYTPVRKYDFKYKYSITGESLLEHVEEHSYNPGTNLYEFFYKNSFEYFDLPTNEHGKPLLFSDTQLVGAHGSLPNNFVDSDTYGFGGGAGLGLSIKTLFFAFSMSLQANLNKSYTYTRTTGCDVNGDGLIDLINEDFFGQRTVMYQNSDGSYTNNRDLIGINSNIGKSSSFSASLAFAISGSAGAASGGASVGHTWSFSDTESGFMDVDGDGLQDFVAKGVRGYYRNTGNTGGSNFVLTPLGSSGTPDYIDTAAINRLRANFPYLDPVKVWYAPYSGTLSIKSDVTLVNNTIEGSSTADSDGAQARLYRNGTPLWSSINNSHIPSGKPGSGLTDSLIVNASQPHRSWQDDNVRINRTDSLTHRVSSIKKTKADAVEWVSDIQYSSVQFFEYLQEQYKPVVPRSLTPSVYNTIISKAGGSRSTISDAYRANRNADSVITSYSLIGDASNTTLRNAFLRIGFYYSEALSAADVDYIVTNLPGLHDRILTDLVYRRYTDSYHFRNPLQVHKLEQLATSLAARRNYQAPVVTIAGTTHNVVLTGSNGVGINIVSLEPVRIDAYEYEIASTVGIGTVTTDSIITHSLTNHAGETQYVKIQKSPGVSAPSYTLFFIDQAGYVLSEHPVAAGRVSQTVNGQTIYYNLQALSVLPNSLPTSTVLPQFYDKLTASYEKTHSCTVNAETSVVSEMTPWYPYSGLTATDKAVFDRTYRKTYTQQFNPDDTPKTDTDGNPIYTVTYSLKTDITQTDKDHLTLLYCMNIPPADAFGYTYDSTSDRFKCVEKQVSRNRPGAHFVFTQLGYIDKNLSVSSYITSAQEFPVERDDRNRIDSSLEASYVGQQPAGTPVTDTSFFSYYAEQHNNLVEKRQYLHVYNSARDFTLNALATPELPELSWSGSTVTDPDTGETITTTAGSYRYGQAENVLYGGASGWYYGEWNGAFTFNPTNIQYLTKSYRGVTETNKEFPVRSSRPGAGPLTNKLHGTVFSTYEVSGPGQQTEIIEGTYLDAKLMVATRRGGTEIDKRLEQTVISYNSFNLINEGEGETTTWSLNGSAGGTFSGSYTESQTSNASTRMYIDLNGDCYPDYVQGSGSTFQVSYNKEDIHGNRYFAAPVTLNTGGAGKLTQTISENFSASAGLSGAKYDIPADGNGNGGVKYMLPISAPVGATSLASASANIGFSQGSTYTKQSVSDINGDGLIDIVSSGSAIGVRYNLGNRINESGSFSAPGGFANVPIDGRLGRVSESVATSIGANSFSTVSLDFGAGAGISICGVDGNVNIGVNAGFTSNVVNSMFIDINGDGLPDKVSQVRNTDVIKVNFNTGSSFTSTVELVTPDWSLPSERGFSIEQAMKSTMANDINNTVSVSGLDGYAGKSVFNSSEVHGKIDSSYSQAAANGGSDSLPGKVLSCSTGVSVTASGGIGVGIPTGTPLTVTISANGSITYSKTSSGIALQDQNGDSLVDHVYIDGSENALRVKLNNFAKVGLINTVHAANGGTISLDYEQSERTPHSPNNMWVFSQLTRDRVYGTEGSVLQYTTKFEYENGKYDRKEREFYGFNIVRTINPNDSYTEISYNTISYALRGRQYEQKQYSAPKTPGLRSTCDLISVSINEWSDRLQSNGSATPRVTEERKKIYSAEVGRFGIPGGTYIETKRTMTYDHDSYPTNIIDYGDINNTQDDVYITILYKPADVTTGIKGLPNSLLVTDSSGTNELRHRTATYYANGKLKTLTQHGDVDSGTYRYTYDGYGNMATVTDPVNYTITYGYDTVLYSLPVSVTDSQGYSSSATYDYALGVELSAKDVAANTIEKEYDAHGRITKVWTGYDDKVMGVPALAFEYHPFPVAGPAKAISRNKVHYASTNTDTITTILFVDALGQSLQVKKDGELFNPEIHTTSVTGMTISSPVVYDNMGREVSSGGPHFEAGYSDQYSAGLIPKYPVTKQYNRYGQIEATILGDGTRTEQYSWINDNELITRTIDANGVFDDRYSDYSGNITKVVLDAGPGGQALTSYYTYNLVNEIVDIIDDQGNVTTVTHDKLGRQTAIKSPDMGFMEWEYDVAGRLISRVDNNLRNKNQKISYQYAPNSHQLMKIVYPFSPDVSYTYGPASATDNSAGRLTQRIDASGTFKYRYGKMGEQIAETQIIDRSNKVIDGVEQFDFKYQYDYLGRLETITYPDNEIVSYTYNNGGLVNSVTGVKEGVTQVYVESIGYNEYEQRSYTKFGNGTETTYTYDPYKRMLSHLQTNNSLNQPFQNMSYTFSNTGNIEKINNTYGDKVIEHNYTYDSIGQLRTARGQYTDNSIGGYSSVQSYNQSYDFDRIGNMTLKVSTGAKNTEPNKALTYSLDYEYDQANPHRPIWIGDKRQYYDANGNLTKIVQYQNRVIPGSVSGTSSNTGSASFYDIYESPFGEDSGYANEAFGYANTTDRTSESLSATEYVWNEDNQLISATVGNNKTVFKYDAEGSRRTKASIHGETVYGGKYFQARYEDLASSKTKHIFLNNTRLVSKNTPASITTTLDTELKNSFYYHADHLGNTNFVSDHRGFEYEHIEYTPYGETWIEERDTTLTVQGLASSYYFSSKEIDKETGLYYFGARYLDPKTSRWISGDPALLDYTPVAPIDEKAKDQNKNLPGMGGVFNPINMNLYHFGGNNPLKYIDPDGRAIETVWDAFSLSVGIASFVKSVESGDVLGAVIDGLGIVADGAALIIPCVPGGASAGIKAARAAKAARIIGGVSDVAGGARDVVVGAKEGDVLQVGIGLLQIAVGSKQLKNGLQPAKINMKGISPNPKDPFNYDANNFNPEALNNARQSIIETGNIASPILARVLDDGTLEIVDGHHRWYAAIQMGIENVPVKIVK